MQVPYHRNRVRDIAETTLWFGMELAIFICVTGRSSKKHEVNDNKMVVKEMTQTIKKALFFKDGEGKEAWLFRIPNNTGDYVDVSNYGARICGIHVHGENMSMQSLLDEAFIKESFVKTHTAGCLFGSNIGRVASDKIWDIAEEGDNYVLFSCKIPEGEAADSELTLGCHIMWVNLNRLIVNYFVSAKEDTEVDLESRIYLGASDRKMSLRSFCHKIQDIKLSEKDVSESEYKELAFVPFKEHSPRFLSESDEIKPMLELAEDDGLLHYSVYSTLQVASVEEESAGNVSSSVFRLNSKSKEVLKAGETLTEKVILGIDFIEIPEEDDGQEPDPFEAFLKASM